MHDNMSSFVDFGTKLSIEKLARQEKKKLHKFEPNKRRYVEKLKL